MSIQKPFYRILGSLFLEFYSFFAPLFQNFWICPCTVLILPTYKYCRSKANCHNYYENSTQGHVSSKTISTNAG